MSKIVPENIKIYHIVHIDRLASILEQGCLWSDAMAQSKSIEGTIIGMSHIKKRRLSNKLNSYANLNVGDCVPFYFCTRSVMLYMLYKGNHSEISYHGGQDKIIHVQADLNKTVEWANLNDKRWVFTDSNAGSFYFNDYAKLSELDNVDWEAVKATSWQDCSDKKQAEFLLEEQFPWELVEGIGVHSETQLQRVRETLKSAQQNTDSKVLSNWYY